MTEPTEADIRAEARRICEEEGIDPPYGVMGELVLAGVRAGIALARRIAAERDAVQDGRAVQEIDGIAYIVPRGEAVRWSRRFGRFALGATWRWSGFGFGFELLRSGALIQIGPVYFWLAAIEKART